MAIIEAKIQKLIYPNYSIAIDENNKEYRFKGGIPGQTVLLKTGKKKAGYYKAKIIEITKPSPLETLNICQNPNEQGGCKFQNVEYEKELEIKQQLIDEVYSEIKWEEHIKLNPSPLIESYRNKMEYTFGDSYKGGPLVLGMHKVGRFYELTEDDGCLISNNSFEKIRKFSQEFFRNKGFEHHHKVLHTGILKFLVVRYSFFENAFMVNLVTKTNDETTSELFDEYLKGLQQLEDVKVTSLFHTISDSISDAIKPDIVTKIWGEDYLTEKINDLIFRISPFSFFQPNPKGAENLYNKALQFAGDINDKIVYDLYCGTGTISQIFAQKAKKVIGVEIVEEAVEKAKENALLNNLSNVSFRANDVLLEIQNLTDTPDIVVLDPPRSGVHHDAIPQIAKMNAKKIVYISCNPQSQVEDIKVFMENGYKVDKIEAYDQFPRTVHVETLVLMTRE